MTETGIGRPEHDEIHQIRRQRSRYETGSIELVRKKLVDRDSRYRMSGRVRHQAPPAAKSGTALSG
jgi:hypothetical protein